MKTVYNLYHWPTRDTVTAEKSGPYAELDGAMSATGWSNASSWYEHTDGGRWLLRAHALDRYHPWCITAQQLPETDPERIQLVLNLISSYGQTDGDHHKAWVIDQTVRLLAADYDGWIALYQVGQDGPETYSWDEGIAP